MASTEQRSSLINRILIGIAIAAAIVALSGLLITNVVYILYMAHDTITPVDASTAEGAALILERAEDAVGSVDLMLSFIQGLSVIIGLGFAAATLYGLRSTQEARQEFKENTAEIRQEVEAQLKRMEEMQKQVETQLGELRTYRPYLEDLHNLRKDLEQSRRELEKTIDNVARVLQADQEFRLRNYDTAYKFASQVLEGDSNNWLALYIAGWLEVHEMDQLDAGIGHLRHVMEIKRDWPAVRAAYGVGVRRKARHVTGEERDRLFLEAESALLGALADAPRLRDFNNESFWGSVGGIRLETGRLDGAMEAYEKALLVTPNSSYPAGNLATLRLNRARQTGSKADQQRALDAFEITVQDAQREQILNPNDYYLWMDIAQSRTILGRRTATQFAEARSALEKALAIYPSQDSLKTSLRGWQKLLEYCPEDWKDVREHLQEAVSRLEEIAART